MRGIGKGVSRRGPRPAVVERCPDVVRKRPNVTGVKNHVRMYRTQGTREMGSDTSGCGTSTSDVR